MLTVKLNSNPILSHFSPLIIVFVMFSQISIASASQPSHKGSFKTAGFSLPFSSPTLVNNDPNIFVKVAEITTPSVVNIEVEVTNANTTKKGSVYKKHFEDFFGFNNQPGLGIPEQFSMPKRKALGSGVIIEVSDKKAIILTNNHVVSQASTIKIQLKKGLNGDKTIIGKLIGADPELDLALIEIPVTNKIKLKALPFGDSDQLKIGEYVMAIGNPFGQGHTVSHGIISSKDREAPTIGKYLQTDTPINPGNSGGPLVNLKGEVIGINNAILARAQGIGFAIPSNSIKSVIKELKNHGSIKRGFIGIYLAELDQRAANFYSDLTKPGQPYVAKVMLNSPAEKAGLKAYDIIISFNKIKITSAAELKKAVISSPLNKKTKVTIIRKGVQKEVFITIKKQKS